MAVVQDVFRTGMLVVLVLMTACSSVGPGKRSGDTDRGADTGQTASDILPALPDDALRKDRAKLIDQQRILWQRGLYLNKYARVRYRQDDPCGDIEFAAHRGDSSVPENSRAGVLIATGSGYDSIEVDVRQLHNDRWVLHHDQRTGRATGQFDGDWDSLASMDDTEWGAVRHRNMETGNLTDERPPTLYEVLGDYRANRRPDQTLNIDVKGDPDDSDVRRLDRLVRNMLGSQGYSYSSGSMDTLKRLRSANHDVYLGLIQSPHRRSVQQVRGQLERATGSDPIYEQHERLIQRAANEASWWYGESLDDYTAPHQLRGIRDALGSNAGLHLDIRRYAEIPAVREWAQDAGLRRVVTYSINGPEFHLTSISALDDKDQLPATVITDSSVYRFCSRLRGPPKPTGSYEPITSYGDQLQRLPADADLSTDALTAQGEYVPESLYLALDGRVRALPDTRKSDATADTDSGDGMAIPEHEEGEKPDIGGSGPVTIDIEG